MASSGWTNGQKAMAIMMVILIYVSTMVGLFLLTNPLPPPSSNNTNSTTATTTNPSEPEAIMYDAIMDLDNFSFYTDYEIDFEMNAPSFVLDSGLSNVVNVQKFSGLENWPAIRSKIEETYFTYIKGCTYSFSSPARPYQQFSEIYDDNYWYEIPSFVSVDSMYHIFHVLYDEALRTMETNNLTIHLERLLSHMIEVSMVQYNTLSEGWWKEQALKNAAFFSVSKKCLLPLWSPPSIVSSAVQVVIGLIDEAEGFNTQWFMHQKEDFSQYIPRGHYTRTEQLKNFFKAMMWLGRMNFRTDPEDDWLLPIQNLEKGRNETAQAILICEVMNEGSSYLRGEDVFRLWRLIYLPTSFFVGESDDLTPVEYHSLASMIYGEDYSLADIQNLELLDDFREHARDLRDPRILSDFMNDYQTMENVTKGMAFLGQRFIPDSYILWQLVHPNVLERFMPTGLDVMNALGSERASQLLNGTIKNPAEYESQIEMLRAEFLTLNQANWTQNLYWLWLYSLIPIINGYDGSYPSFMNTTEWNDKSLVTALGSWTELRHDTILYAKQSYTGYISMVGTPHGYVEPAPKVYARLASLCKLMLDGLDPRYLLGTSIRNRLQRLHALLLCLRDISIKELTSQSLSYDDITTIKNIGTMMLYLERGEERDIDRAALIADVHTDVNSGRVLEEATGDPMVILVAVSYPNGTPYLARGAAYSYYEFPQPMSERLTDELWWEMLDSGEEIAMPWWEESLVAAVYSLHSMIFERGSMQSLVANSEKVKHDDIHCL